MFHARAREHQIASDLARADGRCCSAENLSSDGEGEPSPSSAIQRGLRNQWPTLTHPLESLSFVRPLCEVAAEVAEATGSGFHWKSATTEFTKPYALNRVIGSIDGSLPQIEKKRGTVSNYVLRRSSYIKLCERFDLPIPE